MDDHFPVTQGGETLPWQADTLIGSWHYERRLFEEHKYKTAGQVVQMLIDIVSKNGNPMLSVPVRGDGTIDEDEVNIVEGIAVWMGPNGKGIFATRPWKVYGEGPSVTKIAPKGQFGGARDVRPYTSEGIRFRVKGDILYAFVMGWPENGKVTIKTLARGGENLPREVAKVELLGGGGPLPQVHDIWRAGAPASDLLAPGIYIPQFEETCQRWIRTRSDPVVTVPGFPV